MTKIKIYSFAVFSLVLNIGFSQFDSIEIQAVNTTGETADLFIRTYNTDSSILLTRLMICDTCSYKFKSNEKLIRVDLVALDYSRAKDTVFSKSITNLNINNLSVNIIKGEIGLVKPLTVHQRLRIKDENFNYIFKLGDQIELKLKAETIQGTISNFNVNEITITNNLGQLIKVEKSKIKKIKIFRSFIAIGVTSIGHHSKFIKVNNLKFELVRQNQDGIFVKE